MIIGFDASRAFVKNRTGTENYSYQLLKNLIKLDKENIYKVFIQPRAKIDIKFPSNFQIDLIDFPRLWTQAGLALETFQTKLDVLFVPSHTLPLIRKPGLKTVVTVHDLGAEYLPGLHQLKQVLYLKLMTHYQLKSADKIIAVSNATKEDLIKKIGIKKEKIEVIYEGVDRDLFKPLKKDVVNSVLRYYNLKPKTYFLFVGTIQPRKNLARLIKAFAKFESRIKNIESSEKTIIHDSSPLILAIVGAKGWLADEIYELPKQLEMEDKQSFSASKVRFLGRIDDRDLPALYSGALALTLPSLFEGFGLPILEAFACECPVLTSNLSSTKEIAKDAAILVDPYNIESIAKSMFRIMNHESRIELVKRGLERVKEFSWEKCAKETLAALKEVVND